MTTKQELPALDVAIEATNVALAAQVEPHPQTWIQELVRAWNEAYPRMDIYAKPGTLVMFDGRGGYDSEQEDAKKVLQMRGLYEVEYTEVGSWRTAVKLRGVDGRFNSVLFAAPPTAAHPPAQHEQPDTVYPARPSGEAATERDVPPGKWKVDMPDGIYGNLPGDPPGPCDVRKVIGGYVYFVTPRTGELVALNPPTVAALSSTPAQQVEPVQGERTDGVPHLRRLHRTGAQPMTPILQLAREAGAQVDTFSSNGKVFIDFTPERLSAFRDAVLEEAAKKADALDCAHRCGVGSEVGAAIRAMKGQP